MKATEILKSEHRVIEQVLDCLERIAEDGEAKRQVDVDSARKALDFFRFFTDHCHHGKEEKHLFRLLEARGFSQDCGPVGRMLCEHELGREYLRQLAATVDQAAAGHVAAPQTFLDQVRGYVQLLREHIAKEDQRLFPMADQVLSEADQAELIRSFRHTETHEMGTGAHERYLRVAEELAARYGVARATESERHCAGCCHHSAEQV